MAELNWMENSKAAFDAALKVPPLPFRGISKKNMLKAITQAVGEGGDVHEADLVRVMKENTPGPFLAQALKAVEPHLTDPSILES